MSFSPGVLAGNVLRISSHAICSDHRRRIGHAALADEPGRAAETVDSADRRAEPAGNRRASGSTACCRRSGASSVPGSRTPRRFGGRCRSRTGAVLGEPCGRDTLNAVGFSAAVLARRDPEAIIAVFTADHIIEPVDQFQAIVDAGYALVEKHPETLVTFGIAPDQRRPSGYGYLELGEPFDGSARRLRQFREKPDLETAQQYFEAGPERFLWNSGMFVWRAATLLDCIRRYAPENHAGLMRIADAWDTPRRQAVLEEVYPTLKKISVDYAVMEPASRDPAVTVAAIPMPLRWLDVGSWPSLAETCPRDEHGNALAAGAHVAAGYARHAGGLQRSEASDCHDRLRRSGRSSTRPTPRWSAAPIAPTRSRNCTGRLRNATGATRFDGAADKDSVEFRIP